MPHIVMKLMKGQSEEKKKELAERLRKEAAETLGMREGAFSILFEEVEREEWMDKVYKPEIKPNLERLAAQPDYSDE
ncbi:MAG: 4-oxalocrotonate tautomerase [Crocinitomicaceae bacterium]|nr:4-oxalocrotonate tautomerase [Crocinitomicaceae bacterium]|tara:strand:- start:3386 stop:3616 length:231 start_codon:yes stop_codon:yes gene_type:complete